MTQHFGFQLCLLRQVKKKQQIHIYIIIVLYQIVEVNHVRLALCVSSRNANVTFHCC